jgi:murein DD-endopeptidase MepM/ murein hydrolase activator NlpD
VTAAARFFVVLAVLAAGVAGLAFLRCETAPPEVALAGPIWLGRAPRDVSFTARDAGSGLRRLEVILETGEGARTLLETRAESGWLLGTAEEGPGEYTVSVAGQGLRDGEATLRVRATDWSWAHVFDGNTAEATVPVTIDTKPPRIAIESGLTYVQRAGAATVIYRTDGALARDGVLVDDVFFSGFPAPETVPAEPAGTEEVAPDEAGEVEAAKTAEADTAETREAGGGRRVAVFAVPRDGPSAPKIRVVATDLAGNEASRGWAVEFQDRVFPSVPVELPERFFQEKVPELAGAVGIDPSDVPGAFKIINEKVRAQNEARIAELTRAASEPRHFEGRFLQLKNSEVTSHFAEARSYRYGGQELSHSIHYGYDLASLANAPVTASNAGRVIFADDLGIYGNCVILDHGLGVTSLYGHLSGIDVAVGDLVEKEQTIGTSGATGLAGGDHLHFAILVGGVYVDPLEWWDARWMHDRVEARIAGAAP